MAKQITDVIPQGGPIEYVEIDGVETIPTGECLERLLEREEYKTRDPNTGIEAGVIIGTRKGKKQLTTEKDEITGNNLDEL